MESKLQSLRYDLQEKLVKIVLMTGFFALIAVSFEELQGGNMFRVLVIYLPSFFAIIILFSFKSIPLPVKSMAIVIILTLLGFSELYYFGIKSMHLFFCYLLLY